MTSLRARPLALAHPAAIGLLLAAPLLVERRASAQVHWDAGLDVGGVTRFRSTTNGGTPSDGKQGLGGLVGLKAHVALMPLLRVGAYVDRELTTNGEPVARHLTSVGLRLKLTPPSGRDELHYWIFAGAGYAAVYGPSFHTTINDLGASVSHDGLAYGASGRFLEIPFGIGGAWRFRKPWQLSAELSGRVGVGFAGAFYESDGRPGSAPAGFGPEGNDTFAIVLTVGIGFDL